MKTMKELKKKPKDELSFDSIDEERDGNKEGRRTSSCPPPSRSRGNGCPKIKKTDKNCRKK